MTIDVQWFGYGAALPMIGWICGMVASFIFSALSNKGMR